MMLLGLFLSAGYLIFGRPFAYLGTTPFYPAEYYLLMAALLLPRRWLATMLGELISLRPIAVCSALFIAWGVLAIIRGLEAGYDAEIALKEFGAQYYIIFFFIGKSISPQFDRRKAAMFFLFSGLLAGLSGILYGIYTSKIELFLPWAPDVPVFDVPAMISYLLIGLTAFAPYTGVAGLAAIILDLITVLVTPGRALWLSIVLGFGVILALQPNRRVLLKVGSGVLAVAFVVYTVGSLIPATEGRGGSISPSWIVAQLVATFEPETAYNLLIESGESANASEVYSRYGTVDWRYEIWQSTLDSLDSAELWIFGHGYGIELPSLAVGIENLRSPHNFLIYLLGYTGIVGVILYLILSGLLVREFYQLPPSPYRLFLLGQFSVVWTLALFGNALETPFVAFPFYLGMGIMYGAAKNEASCSKRAA